MEIAVRTYLQIWQAVREHGSATVQVSGRHLLTVRQGVVKIKCEENFRRRRRGLCRFGAMEIYREQIDVEKDLWLLRFVLPGRRNPKQW